MPQQARSIDFYLRRLAVACSYSNEKYTPQLIRLLDLIIEERFEEAEEALESLAEPLAKFDLSESVTSVISALKSGESSERAKIRDWLGRIRLTLKRRLVG